MNLHARIALKLDWSEERCKEYSLQSLRELVRHTSPKLAQELDIAIHSGSYIKEEVES